MPGSASPQWEALFATVGRRPRDDVAWSDLYSALWPYLTDWIISRYGLHPAPAADVLQDALLQYRAKLSSGKTTHPSLPHLRAFIRFCVLTLLRQQSRLAGLDEIAPGSPQQDPERDLLRKLVIDEALDRLDGRCAYILRARYFQGRTSSEIGAALGLDAGHVDVLLHRCRLKCRTLLSGIDTPLLGSQSVR